MRLFITLVLATLASALDAESQGKLIQDKAVGIAVEVPGKDWVLTDLSSSGVAVHIYSPNRPQTPRLTLMRFPKAFLPDGLNTRVKQIEARGAAIKRVRLAKARLAGSLVDVYEYLSVGIRSIEYCIKQGDAYPGLFTRSPIRPNSSVARCIRSDNSERNVPAQLKRLALCAFFWL